MKLSTLNNNNEVINIDTNDNYILEVLTKQLWSKIITKTKDIKRIDYKYSYNDLQKIKITFKNGIKYIFEDIPTTHGCIDINKIKKGGE